MSRLWVIDGTNSLGSKHSYSWDLWTFILVEVGCDCCNSDLAGLGHLKLSDHLTACRFWQIQLLLWLWQMQFFSSTPSINCWRNNFPRTLLPACHLSSCVSSLSLLFPGQHTSRLPVACPCLTDHLLPAASMPALASLLPGACATWPLQIVWKPFMPSPPSILIHEKSFSRNLYLAHWHLTIPFWTNPSLRCLRKFDLNLTVAFHCDYCQPPCLLLCPPFVPYLTNLIPYLSHLLSLFLLPPGPHCKCECFELLVNWNKLESLTEIKCF